MSRRSIGGRFFQRVRPVGDGLEDDDPDVVSIAIVYLPGPFLLMTPGSLAQILAMLCGVIVSFIRTEPLPLNTN